MKKWTVLLFLISAFLGACAQSGPEVPAQTEGSAATVATEPSVDAPVLAMSELRPVGIFREGLLFVQRKSDGAICCIDKEGRIRFQLDPHVMPHQFCDGGFYNGLAVVQIETEDGEGRMALCRTDGTIVTPDSFGGTGFLFSHTTLLTQQERFFADGYIMVVGDGALGLLDADLQWVVPMSAEYYGMILDHAAENDPEGWGTEFYYESGRFLSADGYMDIVSGQRGEILMIRDSIAHPSEFWVEWRDTSSIMFQDALSPEGEMVLSLTGWLDGGSYVPAFTFEDGTAGVLTVGEEGNRFRVIDEQGRDLFEPVRVIGRDHCYDPASGIHCVAGTDGQGDLVIQLFDSRGRLNEFRYDVPETADHCSATVEDGVIMVCIRYDEEHGDGILWELFDQDYARLY